MTFGKMFKDSECVQLGRYMLGWHEGNLQITLFETYDINQRFRDKWGYVLIPHKMLYESDSIANDKTGVNQIIADLKSRSESLGFDPSFTMEEYYNIVDFCCYCFKWQDVKPPCSWEPSEINHRNRYEEHEDYAEWRKSTLIRDKHHCICCGLDKHLQVHHLFGYKENPELATHEHNGVTLCKFCHAKYHSIYGLKNINPIDFIDFIKTYGVVK